MALTWHLIVPMSIMAGGIVQTYCEGECLSTDTKPTTGLYNGSKLIEMDTGTLYLFDAENALWHAQGE